MIVKGIFALFLHPSSVLSKLCRTGWNVCKPFAVIWRNPASHAQTNACVR